MFWVEELKFFLDEKCMDFLLLAENPEGEARAYAFKFRGEIIYIEDIPVNYPRITVCTVKGLKSTIKTLRRNGWEILVNRVEGDNYN